MLTLASSLPKVGHALDNDLRAMKVHHERCM